MAETLKKPFAEISKLMAEVHGEGTSRFTDAQKEQLRSALHQLADHLADNVNAMKFDTAVGRQPETDQLGRTTGDRAVSFAELQVDADSVMLLIKTSSKGPAITRGGR